MIFVTVGATGGFDRLIRYIDQEIAPNISEKFIAQIHDRANYIPKNMEYFKKVNRNEYEKYILKADLIISHAGMGVIIDCIKKKKKLIIFPRDPKRGEHSDSHQYEICKYLEGDNYDIGVVYDLNNLNHYINKKMEEDLPLYNQSKNNLISLRIKIGEYIYQNPNEKIFVVSSGGGHLTQMMELIDVIPMDKIFLISYTDAALEKIDTYKIKRGDDRLVRFRATFLAPYLLMKHQPSLILTNGGGELSIPFAYFGKMMGCKIFFIETISRVDSKSVAAKSIYPIADKFLIQWEKNLKNYGDKAEYWGSVL
ncbi:MAG: PssE/Cps14G family polysaccharide biosynthesis glycosyltransferase [archaeon]